MGEWWRQSRRREGQMVGGVGMGEGQEMIEVEADDVGGGAGEEGALTSCGWGDDY